MNALRLFVISLAVAGELKSKHPKSDSCLENFYYTHEVAG